MYYIKSLLCELCCSHDELDALDPIPNLPHSGMIELYLARQPYLVSTVLHIFGRYLSSQFVCDAVTRVIFGIVEVL